MFILNKNLIPLLAISLIEIAHQENWHAQIIGVSEDNIRIYVAHDSIDNLTYEINSQDVILKDAVLEIDKNEFINDSIYIVVRGESQRLYLELKRNENKNIVVTENKYYLGYYLVTHNANCIIYNNNFSNIITFYNYNKEISFLNISYFNDSFLPNFSLYFPKSDIFLEAELILQIPNQSFKYLPYNFLGYSFKYEINKSNDYYYLTLGNNYALDLITNCLYYSKTNNVSQIILPMTLNEPEFDIYLFLKFNSLNFIFPYHIKLENESLNDLRQIDFEETNKEVEYEETIIFS